MSYFNLDSESGALAERGMQEDLVGWLTTVADDGTPQSSVVSFHWDGETIVLYSQPSAPKVANIRWNPRVSFHLNSDPAGYTW